MGRVEHQRAFRELDRLWQTRVPFVEFREGNKHIGRGAAFLGSAVKITLGHVIAPEFLTATASFCQGYDFSGCDTNSLFETPLGRDIIVAQSISPTEVQVDAGVSGVQARGPLEGIDRLLIFLTLPGFCRLLEQAGERTLGDEPLPLDSHVRSKWERREQSASRL